MDDNANDAGPVCVSAQIFQYIEKTAGETDLASNATEDGELFLEQVVKCLASIVRPDGGKTSRWRSRRNRYGRWRSIFLDSRAERVESALVSSIFLGNALRYRLGAFELCRRVEIGTLFAGMELETAAGASSLGIKPGLQNGTAIRTTRACDGSHHSRSPRTDLLLMRTMFWRALLFLFGAIGIHVAPVAILPLQ